MKKLIIILAAAAMAGCGIYKPYTRPEEIKTDGLYGQGVETVDTMTLGNISWQEMFTDPTCNNSSSRDWTTTPTSSRLTGA